MNAISPMTLEGGASSGADASSGKVPATDWSRSVTRWRAMTSSVSQSKSTKTIEIPGADAERMGRVPAAPLTAVSMGNVMSCSISTGARPVASVTMTTRGALTSGKTSTGISPSSNRPKPVAMAATASTITR